MFPVVPASQDCDMNNDNDNKLPTLLTPAWKSCAGDPAGRAPKFFLLVASVWHETYVLFIKPFENDRDWQSRITRKQITSANNTRIFLFQCHSYTIRL